MGYNILTVLSVIITVGGKENHLSKTNSYENTLS
jgi:hypothetical protein